MDLSRINRGLAWLFAVYNVFAGVVWVLRAGAQALTPLMVALHLGLAWLLIARSGGRMVPGYPWLLWLAAWVEIGWLYRLTGPVVHDGSIRMMDLAIFGRHLNEILSVALPWAWLRTTMGLAYLSYYLLILGPVFVLLVQRRRRDLQAHTFGLMTTYLACFAVYLVLPVLGPRAFVAGAGDTLPQAAGIFARLMQVLFAAGDSLGTAFPSSHCAASVAAALLVRQHFGIRLGILAAIWAGLIVVSTVYTNNHYALDAAAGVSLAWVVVRVIRMRVGQPLSTMTPGENSHVLLEQKGGLS